MWRLAVSLITLKEQIDETFPNRNKASDGSIGDAAHQAVASDHNPNQNGVVCALDITNSPETGFDAHALANTLLENKHPDLKYIISNKRIAGAWTGWNWTYYSGTDPHVNHIHVSVGVGDDGQSLPPYDDKTKWNIGEGMTITKEELDDLKSWKAVGIDAQPYKEAIVNSNAWSDIHDVGSIKAVINDLWQFKKDNLGTSEPATELKPGRYVVRP